MVFNQDTYPYDLLLKCNGRGLFPDRLRSYPMAADLGGVEPEPPGERDQRYPRVRIEEVAAEDPQVVLLPSEPFHFEEEHLDIIRELLPDSQAVQNGRLHLIDGRWISWHGTRMARALAELPELLEPVPS
jgi:ABC-type Fe3+-hydroxamate transport system substrate-binding protein